MIIQASAEQLPVESGSVDLIVTSPPYDALRKYGGQPFRFEPIAQECVRALKPGGVIVWVVADQTKKGTESGSSFEQALYFKKELGLNLHDTMIYEALGTGAKGSNYSYWQAFEYMFVLSKGRPSTVHRIRDLVNKSSGAYASGRYREGGSKEPAHRVCEMGIRTNVWRYAVGWANCSDRMGHPAPFPEALAADHIRSWSKEGDLVLDPMCGSGTVAKMARQLGRRTVGSDVHFPYAVMARERVLRSEDLNG